MSSTPSQARTGLWTPALTGSCILSFLIFYTASAGPKSWIAWILFCLYGLVLLLIALFILFMLYDNTKNFHTASKALWRPMLLGCVLLLSGMVYATKHASGNANALRSALEGAFVWMIYASSALVWMVYASAGLVLLLLVLFMLVMVYDNWRKEGVYSAVALLFTSIFVFPIVAVLEIVDNTVLAPQMSDRVSAQAEEEHVMKEGELGLVDGMVFHSRGEQVDNAFTYRVRHAILCLDAAPKSFSGDHMSAGEVRELTGTDGPVLLLTTPSSLGYTQNPISVYYCYSRHGTLGRCVAEVTNTPWNERVTFVFDPKGDTVPKSLHVSPLIDMNRCWRLKASAPANALLVDGRWTFKLKPALDLSVMVLPNTAGGKTFAAVLKSVPRHVLRGRRISSWWGIRYGFMPQRVALRIYWQAVKLMLNGVRYVLHPRDISEEKYERLTRDPPPLAREQAAVQDRCFVFREFDASCAFRHRTEIPEQPQQGEWQHELPYYDHQNRRWRR